MKLKKLFLSLFLIITFAPFALAGTQTYTAGQSGTFTVPSNVFKLVVTLYGAGGSGGYFAGGGGGGGGVVYQYPLAVSPSQQLTYSVGTGGSAISSQGIGNAGGDTHLGSLIGYGGGAGLYYYSGFLSEGGKGGDATDGTNTATGGAVTLTGAPNGNNGGTYSTTLYGGGSGGNGGYLGGDDGTGGASYSNTHAAKAVTYGGGGGASYGTGGAGANGGGTAGTNGGGGGGCWNAGSSGKGGDGLISFTWTVTPPQSAGFILLY